MAADRRSELIEAGISLLVEQRFQDLLATVETRAVADRVAVTTGSFFHHFRNRSHFAIAVAEAFEAAWTDRVEHLRAASTGFTDHGGTGGVRPAAATEWEHLQDDRHASVVQHLLWAVRDQPLGDDTGRTAGDLLRACYAHLTERVQDPYQEATRLMGREMLPPFTPLDLTVVMTALEEGMQMRQAVDPGAVRNDLYTDAVAALLLGMTRPRPGRADAFAAPELADLEARFLVRRHGEDDNGVPAEVWRHIAESAAHLFIDRSAGDVGISEVAAAAGVTVAAVESQFGSVNAVAAAGWARHLPELEAVAASIEEEPIRRIEQVLLRYVQLCRENRGAAEALAAQVIAEAFPRSDRRWPRSTREIVPVPAILLPSIRELRAAGKLRRRTETERLARSLVHLCTTQALVFVDEPDGRIVDETLSLVFDGALVAPLDG